VSIGFGLISIVLVYLSNKLKKQQKELLTANAEIKRINENLEGLVSERTALLEDAHRELDTFLYKASHDLRGPICSIIGLCHIATHSSNGESAEILERTAKTAHRMDRMLKKLKVISEINQPTDFSSMSIKEKLDALESDYKTFIQQNNVKLTIDCAPTVSLYSYPTLVDAILRSLLENALYFSTLQKTGSRHVQVSVSEMDESVQFVFMDDGPGIEDELKPKIWDMFFVGTEYSGGNGLGLYIVKKSLEVLGGSVQVESELCKYTRFIVTIPKQNGYSSADVVGEPLLLAAQ
jgi:signal transduction histidine kinase